MKLSEAIATAADMFSQPYLPAKWTGNETKLAKAIYNLKKIKLDKKKDKDPKYLDYLLYRKYWMF